MQYYIRLPILGFIDYSIEAESPEEALKKIQQGGIEHDELGYEIMYNNLLDSGNIFQGECSEPEIIDENDKEYPFEDLNLED